MSLSGLFEQEETCVSQFVICTDATCDFTPEIVEKLGVEVFPMEFLIDGIAYHHYPDAREMSMDEFYTKVKAGKMPTTTQISRMVYEEYFEKQLKAGQDVLYIAFSSALSSTYASSCQVAKEMMEAYPGRTICCVDSRCASYGEGMLVYKAVEMQKAGASLKETEQELLSMRDRVDHWVVVDDLRHLHRGGRIPKAAAIAGTALGIKPIIHIDFEGRLIPCDKVRGRKKGCDYLLDKAAKRWTDRSMPLYVVHTHCPEEAKELAERAQEELGAQNVEIHEVGPIIGAHTGAGLLALLYMADTKQI